MAERVSRNARPAVTPAKTSPAQSRLPETPRLPEPPAGWLRLGPAAQARVKDGFKHGVLYRVKWGDTLSGLGKRFGVPYKKIAEANGIHGPDYRIFAGRTILIPGISAKHPALHPHPSAPHPALPLPPRADPVPVVTPPVPEAGEPAAADRAPTADPSSPRVDAPSAPVASPPLTRAELEKEATAAQDAVNADLRATPAAPREQLEADFGRWKTAVDGLVGLGAFDSQAVKDFAAANGQAAILQQNLSPSDASLEGAAYAQAAAAAASKTFYPLPDGTNPVDSNPLLGAKPLVAAPSLEEAKARGVPTVSVEVNGQPAEVRKDVAVVVIPGIARTENDFAQQRQAALDSGFLPVMADTATFGSPVQNDQALAAAITQAKKQLGNPDAKVILVGYSQGATDALALMQDAGGQYADLRKDVLAIHTVDSAAGGSHLADFALALAQYLTTRQPLSADQQQLLKAFETASAKTAGLPPSAGKGIAAGLAALKKSIDLSVDAVQAAEKVEPGVIKKLGLSGMTREELGKALLAAALTGRDLSQEAEKHGGVAGKAVGKLLYPAWNTVLSADARKLLGQGQFSALWDSWTQGGLGSLTPEYGMALLNDPTLRAHLAGVPVINASGSVPAERAHELLPPSQQLPFQFFQALGLTSDSWVALKDQTAIDCLPTSVGLPTAAAGHWGAQGVDYLDASPKNYAHYTPQGWMKGLLTTDAALGLI